MNCIQYYSQLGIDLSTLSVEEKNVIASFFLENMIFTKEEIENLFKIRKSEKIEGGLADRKYIEDIAVHHSVSVEEISKQLEIGVRVEMEHTREKGEAEEIAKDHLWEIPDYYTRLAKMEKEAKEDKLEKGKRAEIGEIREWNGIKMQKTAQGWSPVKKDSSTSKEENGGKISSVEKQEQKKEYSEKELKEFAKKTSESNLKQAVSGGDEQLRIVAKEELERRNVEEVPKVEEKSIEKTKENKDTILHKKKQLEIILNNNPSPDEIHTWIRKEEDIKTAEEAFNESIESDESTPDFKKENMENALKEGFVTIYSSYPIKDGVFVTPSKMEAQSYAGKKDVFSKKVNLDDVAWIDGLQGQFAPINKTEENSKENNTDNKVKDIESKIKELRNKDIDFADEKALNENIEQIKSLYKERENLLKQKSEENKKPFEKYLEGFSNFNEDKDKAAKFYKKESEKSKEYLKNNKDEFEAVNFYLNDGFEEMRDVLSGDTSDDLHSNKIKKISNDVSTFIASNKITKDVVLNRRVKGKAIQIFNQLNKGDIYTDKSFSSCSLVGLEHFGDYNISILAKKDRNVANVDNVGEFEYLIDKDSKFKVVDKTDKGIIVELL